MKPIRVIVLSVTAVLVVACCAFLTVMNKEIKIPEKTYDEDPQLIALTSYGKELTKRGFDIETAWDRVNNSTAGYLQNPDIEVTADNFQQCFYDFLSAPNRLYFFNSNLNASENEAHKCDAPEISVKFAEAFQGVILEEGTREDYMVLADEYNKSLPFHTDTAVKLFYFDNITGAVSIYCGQNHSCISFYRYIEETDTSAPNVYFYADEDLTGKLDAIYMKVLPYTMEVAPMELE